MYTINCHTGEVLKHKDDERAMTYSIVKPATLAVKEPRDLMTGLLTQNIVWLYHKITGSKIVMNGSRKAVAEQLFTAMKRNSTAAPTLSEQELQMPAIKKSTRRFGSTKRTAGEPRRVSQLAGKHLTKVEKKNPYREGSSRFKSWDKYSSGATYEKAVAAGARPADIRVAIIFGHLKASK